MYNRFPIPSPPRLPPPVQPIDPEVVASTPPRLPAHEPDAGDDSLPDTDERPSSQNSTKENDGPTDIAAGRGQLLPGFYVSDSQKTEEFPSPVPPTNRETQLGGNLPPELLSMYQTSTRILQYDFAESPPYTIQRLAELVLRPNKHYRFLPAYLRALDRVVSVTSPVSDFPLPSLHAPLNGGFLTNGDTQVNGISEREGLGSDEALGGALLTPIPWLMNQANVLTPRTASEGRTQGELHSESTETIDGPHGVGSIETVSVTLNGIHSMSTGSSTQPSSSPIASPTLSEQSDASTSSASSTELQLREQGGVTQGELLRQEQEAGVVPVNPSGQPMTPRRHLRDGGVGAVGRVFSVTPAVADLPMAEDLEEQPHARGPEEIGMEDMGPQPAGEATLGDPMLNMEAAVGRGRSKSPQPTPPVPALFPGVAKDGDMEGVETGARAQDPSDVEKEVEKLKEVMDREKEEEGKDTEGDVVVADVDGVPVVDRELDTDNPLLDNSTGP